MHYVRYAHAMRSMPITFLFENVKSVTAVDRTHDHPMVNPKGDVVLDDARDGERNTGIASRVTDLIGEPQKRPLVAVVGVFDRFPYSRDAVSIKFQEERCRAEALAFDFQPKGRIRAFLVRACVESVYVDTC